jgi:archaellum component FlaF (FlaF/FlaG flagellin family)
MRVLNNRQVYSWEQSLEHARRAFSCPLVHRYWNSVESALESHWDAYRRINGYDTVYLNIVYVLIRGEYVKKFQFYNHADKPITPPLSAISATVKLSKAINKGLNYEL